MMGGAEGPIITFISTLVALSPIPVYIAFLIGLYRYSKNKTTNNNSTSQTPGNIGEKSS